MDITTHDPPRRFNPSPEVELADCARIDLAPGEQVTFAPGHDVTRTAWGYYATASVNKRLLEAGLHALLVRNGRGRVFVVLVERGREREFGDYCTSQGLRTVASLADEAALDLLEAARPT